MRFNNNNIYLDSKLFSKINHLSILKLQLRQYLKVSGLQNVAL